MVGTAPLGYDIIDRKYIVNKKEKPIVQFIYDQYLKGFSYYDIILQCNQLGYKTKKNQPFKKNSLYEILHNEKYTGTYIYNKSSGNNRHNINENIIRIENAFEPIISKKQFLEVQNKTAKNKKQSAQYKAKEIYLLSGLLFCGKCGARYTGQTTHKIKNNTNYSSSYYSCSNRNKIGKCTNHRLNRYLLENEVIKALYNKILNGNSVDTLLDKVQIEYKKLTEKNNICLDSLKHELKDINKKIDNLTLLASENPLKSILSKMQDLEEQKEDIIFRLDHLDLTANNTITPQKVKDALNKDIQSLQKGSKIEIKNLIHKYIKKIIVAEDKIEIDYTFSNTCSYNAHDMTVLNTSGRGDPYNIVFKTYLDIKNILTKSL